MLKVRIAILLASSLSFQSLRAQPEKSIQEMSFKEIIDSYFFVADFERKIPEHDVSEHLFWRYPFKVGRGHFAIEYDFDDMATEIPVTHGEGKPYHYLNSGRVAFFKGEYEKAKNIWLEGRRKFKTNYPFHRRLDYFIAMAYLHMARAEAKGDGQGIHGINAKALFKNAATFLSWSLFKKEDIKDPLFDLITAKQAYNLAVVYYQYRRYASSYGAANRGIEFLRRVGKNQYHTKLSRILAESFIQNRSYQDAIQTYDVTLRQDPSAEDAAAIFARVGDIYFDLNNYNIAAMNYEISDKIYRDSAVVDVGSMIFRAESEFWKGNFKTTNTLLRYALSYAHTPQARSLVTYDTEAYARLRLADSYLALGDMKRAKARFYDLSRNYRGHIAGKTAKIRAACLDLPQFEGNNVMHARATLQTMKYDDVFPQARELAWACEVGSHAARERTVAMIDRVREFYKKFPRSRFLKSLVEPVAEVRKQKLQTLLAEEKTYEALAYYRAHRELLFKDADIKTKRKLFRAAIDMGNLAESRALYSDFDKDSNKSDLNLLRKAVFLAEIANDKKASSADKRRIVQLAKRLERHPWKLGRSVHAKNMLHRVLDTKTADKHLIWIYNLMQGWPIDSEATTCTEQFPLMSKLYQYGSLKPKLQAAIRGRVAGLTEKLLPNLLRTDELCAVGLLNFEIEVNEANNKALVRTYLARLDWPMGEELASVFWNVSEIAGDLGMKSEARQLWRAIIDKAPKTSPKVAFAKNRLEPRQTEVEKLWE